MTRSSSGTGRTQRHLTTRHAIEEVAWRLFRTQGFDATTVDEIASRAGVSQRTFFRYFDCKEAVVYGDWQWQLDALTSLTRDADPDLTPEETIRFVLVGFSHLIEQQPGLSIRTSNEVFWASDRARSYFRNVMRPAMEEAVIRELAARLGTDPETDLPTRTLAGAGFGAYFAAAWVWAVCNRCRLLAQLTEQAFDTLGWEPTQSRSATSQGGSEAESDTRAAP